MSVILADRVTSEWTVGAVDATSNYGVDTVSIGLSYTAELPAGLAVIDYLFSIEQSFPGYYVVLETTFSADVVVELADWEIDLGLDTTGRWGTVEREKCGPIFRHAVDALAELMRQASPDAITVTWDGVPFGENQIARVSA